VGGKFAGGEPLCFHASQCRADVVHVNRSAWSLPVAARPAVGLLPLAGRILRFAL